MADIVLDGEMGTEEGSDLLVLMRCEGDGDDGRPMFGARHGENTIVGVRQYSAMTIPEHDVVSPSESDGHWSRNR